MKIYFEDGKLVDIKRLPVKPDFVIDATNGISDNYNELDFLKHDKDNNKIIVYTNSIAAFSNTYVWNKELNVPELFIRAGKHMIFTRIDKLTNKQLRATHNLSKMYLAGEFGGTHEWLMNT